MHIRKNRFIFSITFLVLILDQITKILASNLNTTKPIINGIFHLTFTKNYGAGFSILQNQTILLILFTLIAIGFIFYYYNKIPEKKYVMLSVSFILAGAIGNLIDRIRLGYVIDFLDFQIWPVFNIADSAITIGTILLIIYLWKSEK